MNRLFAAVILLFALTAKAQQFTNYPLSSWVPDRKFVLSLQLTYGWDYKISRTEDPNAEKWSQWVEAWGNTNRTLHLVDVHSDPLRQTFYKIETRRLVGTNQLIGPFATSGPPCFVYSLQVVQGNYPTMLAQDDLALPFVPINAAQGVSLEAIHLIDFESRTLPRRFYRLYQP